MVPITCLLYLGRPTSIFHDRDLQVLRLQDLASKRSRSSLQVASSVGPEADSLLTGATGRPTPEMLAAAHHSYPCSDHQISHNY